MRGGSATFGVELEWSGSAWAVGPDPAPGGRWAVGVGPPDEADTTFEHFGAPRPTKMRNFERINDRR